MNGSTKIQPSHKQRQGVVYLRQSSPKQVLKNCESAINQRSLRNRLFELGWRKDQIVLIDDDQGQSGKHAAGREGFQRLVADVSLRKVGIIIGTEVSRLSRTARIGTGCWSYARCSTRSLPMPTASTIHGISTIDYFLV